MRLYFPELEPWAAWSASLPAVPPVYLWANVVLQGATRHSAWPTLHHSESGPLGLSVQMWGRRVCQCSDCLRHLSHTLPAPFIPHSASLSPATATRVLSTLVPVSAPTTSLDECLFSIFLVLVPLAVRFSVSSGCARRRSVSTYTAILVPPGLTEFHFFFEILFTFSLYVILSSVNKGRFISSPICVFYFPFLSYCTSKDFSTFPKHFTKKAKLFPFIRTLVPPFIWTDGYFCLSHFLGFSLNITSSHHTK